jgi:hypothetical protein
MNELSYYSVKEKSLFLLRLEALLILVAYEGKREAT